MLFRSRPSPSSRRRFGHINQPRFQLPIQHSIQDTFSRIPDSCLTYHAPPCAAPPCACATSLNRKSASRSTGTGKAAGGSPLVVLPKTDPSRLQHRPSATFPQGGHSAGPQLGGLGRISWIGDQPDRLAWIIPDPVVVPWSIHPAESVHDLVAWYARLWHQGQRLPQSNSVNVPSRA